MKLFYYLILLMNQIDLFATEVKKDNQEHASKSKEKRPSNINISKIHSSNHKWKQCKIIGKNISIRSYSAACAFQNKFYLYGGYQILNGSLHDFYSISLNQDEPTFVWEQIITKGDINPGSRTKHALLGGKHKIYLVGGLQANNSASNQIFQFNPIVGEWKLLKPEGLTLPPIESFGAVLVDDKEERIIVAFGFDQNSGALSNAVYEYNISKNKISLLFQATNESKDVPSPRIGCALAADNNNLYIFGGKNDNTRLNDIWSFSLNDYKFSRLKDEGEIPSIRNGHSMNCHDGKLYVFGGIHDITWQLDDLHIFDLKTNRWTTLQQDSPRKIQKKNNNSGVQQQEEKNQDNKNKKKNWYDVMGGGLVKGNNTASNANNPNSPLKNFSITYNEDTNRSDSPGKMLDEQRKKVFYQKKAEMLKNFQITEQEKAKLVILQTSSQAMKNSLDVIGNPDPKSRIQEDKLTQFGKQTFSKFLQPLQNNSNIVIGKKPCARDGHCCVIIGEQLIIFGGDRHQMSFNDIYKLNLKLAEKDLPVVDHH